MVNGILGIKLKFWENLKIMRKNSSVNVLCCRLALPSVSLLVHLLVDVNNAGNLALMEVIAANGAVAGANTALGKRRLEERYAFDKRLRFSVRQTESAYRYRDIVVKKQDGFTHILLSTKSSENNTLNPEVRPRPSYTLMPFSAGLSSWLCPFLPRQVMKEIQSALATAASDDSKMVLLGAVGSVFCCGLDFLYFIRRLTDDRKKESIKMAETIR